MTPDADPQMTRETGFHDCFAEKTRNFIDYKGFWLANCFAGNGPISEYWAAREKAVILDLSALRKCEVTGPDAEALMQYTLTRNIRKLAVGQVVYTAMCYEHGGMVDDGTLFRLGKDNFRWIGGSDTVACGCANRQTNLEKKSQQEEWRRQTHLIPFWLLGKMGI